MRSDRNYSISLQNDGMRFLKTLQRVQTEQPSHTDEPSAPNSTNGNGNSKPAGAEGIISNAELRIGTPTQEIPRKLGLVENVTDSELVNKDLSNPAQAVSSAPFPEDNYCRFTIDAANVNEHLVAITQPKSAYCEEYRNLRTHVLHTSAKRDVKSITILSVATGEGKSVTAINLAWLLAQIEGVRALIIDGDLRSPSIDKYLGLETDLGLSGVLEGRGSLAEAIVRFDPVGLNYLPAGGGRNDVAELISGSNFKDLLDETREMFDYVIIDAPPIGLFSDGAVIANHSDSSILVLRANQVRFMDISRVLEILPQEKILGTVFNYSEEPLAGRDYYDYSYYKKH